ncbi:MAG: polysaccharide biosynthesis protein [Micromonosporaceae bacterium]|nr:polysaccharide biosynthesis protein [Micromonosporaceae bacterium]
MVDQAPSAPAEPGITVSQDSTVSPDRAAPPEGAARRAQVESLAVAVALFGANALGYLFNLTAARGLANDVYGALGSLMALLLVGVVPAMGLQTAAALHIAGLRSAGGDVVAGERRMLGCGVTAAAGVGAATAAASPLLAGFLHLPGHMPVLLLAATLAPLTLHGLFVGTLQGNRRFAALAALVCVDGLGKFGGGLAGLFLTRTLEGALGGMAVGGVTIAVAGWLVCGARGPALPVTRLVGKVFHATWALFGMVLLMNLDIVLAQHHLAGPAAGDYAVGFIVTKIALWLPQAVGVVVLPRLADPEDRRRAVPIALGLIALLDSAVVLTALVLGPSLFTLIGGPAYARHTGQAWMFAAVGSMLALAHLLLYSRISAADRVSAAAVWAAVGVEIALVTLWLHGSVTQVSAAALATTTSLVVFGLIIERGARIAVRDGQITRQVTPGS